MDHYQNSSACIAVVLAHFNGSSWLERQLQSIQNQTHKFIDVYIFDDCSRETEFNRCKKIASKYPVVKKIFQAPFNRGFSSNFINGLRIVGDGYDYYAFSDQDDIWYSYKLEKAIASMDKFPSETPTLYCGRTEISDELCDQTLGYSPSFKKPYTFANALVQNIGGGNTMVLNAAVRDLLFEGDRDLTVVSHDWWCYQVVTGAGGHVIYDLEPCLKYRQHDRNLVGANIGWRARFLRLRALLQGRFRKWNDINLEALLARKDLLTTTNQRVIDDFVKARQVPLLKRLMLFKRSGVYRQSLLGDLTLLLAIILNKA